MYSINQKSSTVQSFSFYLVHINLTVLSERISLSSLYQNQVVSSKKISMTITSKLNFTSKQSILHGMVIINVTAIFIQMNVMSVM